MGNGRKWTEVVTGRRKAPYINDNKWYQTSVIKNRCELLSLKEGNNENTPGSQES
jgi:hypothetical protein